MTLITRPRDLIGRGKAGAHFRDEETEALGGYMTQPLAVPVSGGVQCRTLPFFMTVICG